MKQALRIVQGEEQALRERALRIAQGEAQEGRKGSFP